MRYFKKENNKFYVINEQSNPTDLSVALKKLEEGKWKEITESEYFSHQIDKPLDVKYEKINHLKNLLMKTDYNLFKYLEGDLTKEEYLPIMENRKRWRREINELEGSAPSMPAQIK